MLSARPIFTWSSIILPVAAHGFRRCSAQFGPTTTRDVKFPARHIGQDFTLSAGLKAGNAILNREDLSPSAPTISRDATAAMESGRLATD
jgi:hypothetical protein